LIDGNNIYNKVKNSPS